jgi:autotransporter-associated beta strand protein
VPNGERCRAVRGHVVARLITGNARVVCLPFESSSGKRLRVRLACSTALTAGALILGLSGAGAVDVSTQPQLDAAISVAANPINVVAGNLALTGSQTFAPSTDLSVAAGASLSLTNANQTLGSLGGGGILTLGSENLTVGSDNKNTAFSGTINMTNQGYSPSPFGSFLKLGTGTLTINNATLQFGEAYIAQGAMAQTSGNTAITYLAVGEGVTGLTPNVGALNVSGGTIAFGTALQVGDFGGQGTVNQTGGIVQIIATCGDPTHCSSIHIGNQGGTGVYNISGGELELVGGLNGLGRTNGTGKPGSSGTLNISGGLVDVSVDSTGVGNLIIGYGNASASEAPSQGVINQTGGVVRVNAGAALYLAGQNASTGTYNLNGGTLQIGGSSLQAGYLNATPNYQFNLGGGTIQAIGSALTTSVNAMLIGDTVSTIDTNGLGATFSGILSGGGALAKVGVGTLVLSGANSYTGGTFLNGGVVSASADNNLGGPAGGLICNGGTLQLGATFTSARDVVLNGGTIDTNGFDGSFSGAFSGSGGLTKQGAGILMLSGPSSYVGATSIDAGTLRAGAINAFAPASNFTVASGGTLDLNGFNQTIGSLGGAGAVALGAATLSAGNNGSSTTFSGDISGAGGLTKTGAGTLILSGANTYTGLTTIRGGTLSVASTGSIANSSVFINNGGVLSGDGAVGPVTVRSGGVLAPDPPGGPGTIVIAGNLAFQSGAVYLVQMNSSANVAGSASLTGAGVQLVLTPGTSMTRSFEILRATGGLGGTAFTSITTNTPALTGTMSYTPDGVQLTLNATLGAGTTLNANQQNVANAINTFFNNGGAVPANFDPVFGLSGGNLAGALSQLDGEAATGAERSAFQLTTAFLGLMLDPFVGGRGSGIGGFANAFASEEQAISPPDIALGYASVPTERLKPSFDQRWTAWGSAYGGTNVANGNAAAGSNNITASAYGFAGGMDYHVSPNAIVGFALAGAGTNWGLANALGGGRSDAVQAGTYGIGWFGPAYLAGALAFTNHWFSTNRSALGDQLSADFVGQSYGARLEGGYRYAMLPTLGVTPYGAVQFQDFQTPAYSESGAAGGGFGLSYNAMNATDVRTELGTRFDGPVSLFGKPLVLYGRLAWAHDFVSNPSLGATFETLPGANFTVNGAPIPQNSALTTAGAQFFLTPRWTLLAKFDGEFANGSQTYAGSGTLRYTW